MFIFKIPESSLEAPSSRHEGHEHDDTLTSPWARWQLGCLSPCLGGAVEGPDRTVTCVTYINYCANNRNTQQQYKNNN